MIITRAEIVESFNKLIEELKAKDEYFDVNWDSDQALERMWEEHPKFEALRKAGGRFDDLNNPYRQTFKDLVMVCLDDVAWRTIRSMVIDELIAEGIIERKGAA